MSQEWSQGQAQGAETQVLPWSHISLPALLPCSPKGCCAKEKRDGSWKEAQESCASPGKGQCHPARRSHLCTRMVGTGVGWGSVQRCSPRRWACQERGVYSLELSIRHSQSSPPSLHIRLPLTATAPRCAQRRGCRIPCAQAGAPKARQENHSISQSSPG